MNGVVTFLVIGAFAPKTLRDIFLDEKGTSGFLMEAQKNIGLDFAHADNVSNRNGRTEVQWFPAKRTTSTDEGASGQSKWNIGQEKFIPLILCDDRESLKKKGIACPYEFVIERKDLLPLVDDGKRVSESDKILAMRMETLLRLYGDKPKGYFVDALKDWFAGAFRLILMLDSTTHGTSQYIDLELVKNETDPILKALAKKEEKEEEKEEAKTKEENEDEHVTRLWSCFRSGGDGDDEVKDYLPLAKVLFSEYFLKWENGAPQKILGDPTKITNLIDRSITKVLNWGELGEGDKLHQLCRIYTDSDKALLGNGVLPREHKDRLPLAFGDRAKYVTPTGKLNLLLIDDDVDKSPFKHLKEKRRPEGFASTISNDDWTLLRDIFNVRAMSVDKNKGDIYAEAVKTFREFQEKGLTYDLILVDLCLGNNVRGADLDGYAMIRIVKVFFPGTPIVVYSRFSDMEHIARAFSCGAKWFLVKGEEAKLPRHVLKLLKQVGWHREWRSVKNSSQAPEFLFEKQDGFTCRFNRTEEWKYLTYKSLEYFPGKFIAVKKMGGGISSAVTFKATKGVKLGEDFLQTPCIIKIDTSYNTMMEFERYFRMIRPYIANECGRVEMPERVLNRTYSSIVYTFAGKQDQAHTLESMGDMLDDNVACQTACDYETYRYVLKCIFDEILPKIHRVSPELELADIGKPSASPSEVMDAFKWKWEDKSERESSFPNYYFSEFKPSEFWKSYMLRMQPWGRVAIEFKEETWPFESQEAPEQEAAEQKTSEPKKRQRLIFHNVMTEPFARLDDAKKDRRKKAGKRIIEAYTDDRRLVWLEGDACDFVARFRKRVSPGTSLWVNGGACCQLGEIDRIPEEDESADQSKQDAVALSNKNGRLCWLNDTLKYKSTGDKDATAEFVRAITNLLGIRRASAKGGAESRNIEDLGFYITLQDAILGIARQASAKADKADEWNMKCPVGIVHGDLNVKNIMLESRKHPPKEDDPDVTRKVSDVWLIDFARTRRDIIAHDFNVFFTSVLGELFTEGLIGKEDKEKSAHQKDYWEKLVSNFRTIVTAAVAPESKSEKGVPDEIKDNRRFTLIYRILRRTHDAARTAGVSQNMYLLTTALACLYTLKIFLNNGCKVRLAAGYFAAAWICYDLLCEAIDIDNKMEGYTRVRVEVANTSVPTEMTGGATE